jgi:hypothetical protein
VEYWQHYDRLHNSVVRCNSLSASIVFDEIKVWGGYRGYLMLGSDAIEDLPVYALIDGRMHGAAPEYAVRYV